jgi:hypothetical protein
MVMGGAGPSALTCEMTAAMPVGCCAYVGGDFGLLQVDVGCGLGRDGDVFRLEHHHAQVAMFTPS